MARWLAGLLMMSGLVLLSPPPAHAAVSVTIRASATTVTAGQSVTFSGKAWNANVGSVLTLQRRVGASWVNVAQLKIGSTRAYAFRTIPPRGYQLYRVFKVRQLGQAAAVSAGVRLAVRWRPTVTAAISSSDFMGTYETVRTSVFEPGMVVFQQRRLHPQAAWISGQANPLGSAAINLELRSQGFEVRYFIPGSGLRLPAYSAIRGVVDPWGRTSRVANLNEQFTSENTNRHAAFYASQATEVQIALEEYGDSLAPVASVYDPAGVKVLGDFSITGGFVTARSGWYTIMLGEGDVLNYLVTLASTRMMTTPLNAELPTGPPPLPGQVIQQSFTGIAGQLVSARGDFTCGEEALVMDGKGTPPIFPGWTWSSLVSVWQLPRTGTYVMRQEPCGIKSVSPVMLHSPLIQDVGISEGAWLSEIPRDGQLAVGRVHLAKGDRFFATGSLTSPRDSSLELRLGAVTPSGEAVGSLVTAQEDGEYLIIGRSMSPSTGRPRPTVPYSGGVAIHLTPPVHFDVSRIGRRVRVETPGAPRELGLRFTGEAGELVTSDLPWDLTDNRQQWLIDEEGNTIDHFLVATRKVWRLPASGNYELMSLTRAASTWAGLTRPMWIGDMIVNAPAEHEFVLTEPGSTMLSSVELVAGRWYQLSGSQEFGPYNFFKASLTSPTGEPVATLGDFENTSRDFYAYESGRYTVAVSMDYVEMTGTAGVRLSTQ